MTAPPEDVAEQVRQWLQLAADDLDAAQELLKSRPQSSRIIAFHAQQSAEKNLKAYLIWRRMEVPFTHNISALLELCEPIADWSRKLIEAESLSMFAVSARYPGLGREVSKKTAREAVTIAQLVSTTIRETLANEGLD